MKKLKRITTAILAVYMLSAAAFAEETHTAQFKVNVYNRQNVTVTESSFISENVAYLSSILTAKKDKVFTVTFNSLLNSETVTDENIFINKSNGDSLPNIITLNKTGEKISVALETGIYNNGFYTLNILKGLKSKGGNGLSDNISVPFYVPFH